jgi:hypothetical protein
MSDREALLKEEKPPPPPPQPPPPRTLSLYNRLRGKKELIPQKSANGNNIRGRVASAQPVVQALQVGTVGTSVAIATGALTVAGATVAAAPVAAGVLLISLFALQVSNMVGINKELQVNYIAIADEARRMYFIVKVVEEFAKKYNITVGAQKATNGTIELNLEKVNFWMERVLNRIIKAAGPDTYNIVLNSLTNVTYTGQETVKEKRKNPFKQWRQWFKRVIQPAEQLRLIVRDVTILSIFFQIFMSEFHILLMVKQDTDKGSKGLEQIAAYQTFKEQSLKIPKPTVGKDGQPNAAAAALQKQPLTETAVQTALEGAAAANTDGSTTPNPTTLQGGTRRIRRKSLRAKPRKRLSRVL